MRVIFLDDVQNVARAGYVKVVADGFARNFLIPKKLAARASADQLKRIERIKSSAVDKRAREMTEVQAVAEKLTDVAVTVKAKVGPNGEYYGAITAAAIASEIAKTSGVPIDRKLVEMASPINKPGDYEINVRLGQGTTAPIKVTAEAE